MRSRLSKVVALSVLYLSSAGMPGLYAAPETPTLGLYVATELKAKDDGHFYAKAEINGSSITVVVDTGASAVALPYGDADRAGLHPRNLNYNIPVSTANGVIKAAEVTLRKVEINGVKVNDVRGLVMPEGALGVTLLGMSYLSRLQGFSIEDGVLKLKN